LPATQIICQNQAIGGITVSPSGGLGTFSYQWYSNTVNSTIGGTDLGNANGAQTATYTPPASATPGTTYYYCVISQSVANCGPVTSATASVTINGINPGSIEGNQIICAGGDPAAFTVATAASGSGALTYQWQSNTSGCAGPWTDINTATAATYDIPAGLAVTTYYRRIAISTLGGVGCQEPSNCVTVTVNAVPTTSPIYHH
jgi:hypothetical protein